MYCNTLFLSMYPSSHMTCTILLSRYKFWLPLCILYFGHWSNISFIVRHKLLVDTELVINSFHKTWDFYSWLLVDDAYGFTLLSYCYLLLCISNSEMKHTKSSNIWNTVFIVCITRILEFTTCYYRYMPSRLDFLINNFQMILNMIMVM